MKKDRETPLCEYSDEESAFVKGALPAEDEAEGERFKMELCAKEFVLCDFTMYEGSTGEEFSYFDGDQTDDGEDFEDVSGTEILAKIFSEAEKNPASEEYSISCGAYLSRDDRGRIVVSYTEILDVETEQQTQISFDPAVPGLVTIYKSGAVSSVMTIEEGRRHTCTYRTPFMDFEMRVHALRAENTIGAEGGRLTLDYALEIRGAAAHRTVMSIVLKKEEM